MSGAPCLNDDGLNREATWDEKPEDQVLGMVVRAFDDAEGLALLLIPLSIVRRWQREHASAPLSDNNRLLAQSILQRCATQFPSDNKVVWSARVQNGVWLVDPPHDVWSPPNTPREPHHTLAKMRDIRECLRDPDQPVWHFPEVVYWTEKDRKDGPMRSIIDDLVDETIVKMGRKAMARHVERMLLTQHLDAAMAHMPSLPERERKRL